MTPIKGWLPDADPTMPGMLTDCQRVMGTVAGYAGAPAPIKSPVNPLTSPVRGAVVATQLNGNRRIFAGTQTNLYQLTTAVWNDVSKSGGYVGSSESRWSLAQFGDTTLASNLADPMQQITGGASLFADVPTAPKAKIIVTNANNFVLAFYTNEATYGVAPDRWWCCAQNNQTDWVPNVSTGANTGRLIAAEGAITAAMVLGDYVVAYKTSAIFVGTFVGSPIGFQWNKMPGGPAGAVGQEAVCDIGGAHFIVGESNFWIFDGTRPIPIGVGETRDWFYFNSSPSWRYRTQATFDQQHNLVRVCYASVASRGELDRVITYNVLTKQWGRDDAVVETSLNYIEPGTTINGMDNFALTINALPNIPVDSPFWLAGGRVSSYFDSTHQLVSLNGTTTDSFIVTGDLGDDDGVTMIDRFRVRYSQAPTTANATGQTKFSSGDRLVPGPINAINDGKFDLRQTARWHRVRVDMTGGHVETAFDVKPILTGQR
jgi:hypothetical protein